MRRKLLSLALSLAMVIELVPTPALAEIVDELGDGAPDVLEQVEPAEGGVLGPDDASGAADDDFVVEDVSDGDAAANVEPDTPEDSADSLGQESDSQEAQSDPALTAQEANEDPFYFVDYQTGQRVTELHTSGTYRLVNPDGTAYVGDGDDLVLKFTPTTADVRGNRDARQVGPKCLYSPESDGNGDLVVVGYLLEDLIDQFDGWQLPSCTYNVSLYDGTIGLAQRYTVVNDGAFMQYYDFAYGNDNPAFSVKPYTEGATDEDYSGWRYNEEGGYYYQEEGIAEQAPFIPGSDVRLKLDVSTAMIIEDGTKPQLESIGLWKADETLESLEANYADLSRYYITRDTAELVDPWDETEAKNPSFPTYLNFAEDHDAKVTTIWEREEGSLDERFSVGGNEAGDMGGTLFVDHANFASAQVESGLYFPVVKMSYKGETYTLAYYPIEVAESAGQRTAPRITTTSLAKARVDETYEAALAGRSGAKPAGTLTWSVDGTLPEGLSLDAASGVISGTPTEAGKYTLAATLTETIDGDEPLTATKTLTLTVLANDSAADVAAHLALGDISYTPGAIWPKPANEGPTYLELSIPISHDIREYDLGETELWYMVCLETGEERTSRVFVHHKRAADLYKPGSDDTLLVDVVLQGTETVEAASILDTKAVKSVTVFLVPKTNDGAYAFDLGELTGGGVGSDGTQGSVEPVERTLAFRYGPSDNREDYTFIEESGYSVHPEGDSATYANLPDMSHATLADPDVTIGSWVSIPALSFDGNAEDWPTTQGRVRIWTYAGANVVGEPQERDLSEDAVFKLAPGTYAFSAEGLVPEYDENGIEVPGSQYYIDIVGKAPKTTVIKGTNPKQYVFTLGPNEGSQTDPKVINVMYTADSLDDVNRHSISPTFESSNGSFVSSRDAGIYGFVNYEVRWYRRVDNSDPTKDVLVATGDTAMFGPSSYDLYVEVIPTGRDASFWKSTGKLAVSATKKVVSVQVHRKQHFSGTFTLSCTSGRTPEAGTNWGIIEVKTPTMEDNYISSNIWAGESPITVPNLTSGSIVTFTPRFELGGGSVSYVVPEDAEADFSATLTAPLAEGTITLEGLSFTDVKGETTEFALDDGATEVSVARVDENGDEIATVPFYVVNDATLILQPEVGSWYTNDTLYFMGVNRPTNYRVTVIHHDTSAPERMGTMLPDYAAKEDFTVTLSQSETTASVPAAALVSRGYAELTLPTEDSPLSMLLLYQTTYDSEGNLATSTLVEKHPAGWASDLRTPFLDAGTYTLYVVDANLLGRFASYESIEELRQNILVGPNSDRASSVDFTVEDGAITKNVGGTSGSGSVPGLATWSVHASSATDIINKKSSYVTCEIVYGDKLDISMHAELAKGTTLTDDAYLEIVTNQETLDDREGLMNPQSLIINGKAMRLNRWENLFNQQQKMYDGVLPILLSEAKKQGANCAKFPMDLSLVIPRRNNTSIDVSVWLVSNAGKTRSLVGSYSQVTSNVSLSVPSTVAWKSFYVHGETAPSAYVTVLLDGVRAGTTRADTYGYYAAEVTLPDSVGDFDAFAVSTMAQWTVKDSNGHTSAASSTSPTHVVTYTTTFPVVERITMCYQSQPGEDYHNIVSYYRGKNPNEHVTLYRSEHDDKTQGDDHAKDFWIVEFANGKDVCDVKVSVSRSDGAVELNATDSLRTAASWIPDVVSAQDGGYSINSEYGLTGNTGTMVRTALSSDTTHGFVTKPAYFTYAPDNLDVNFDFDGDMTIPMTGLRDSAPYSTFKSGEAYEQELAGYLGDLATRGNMRYCSAEDVNLVLERAETQTAIRWDELSSYGDQAHAYAGQGGTVDDYLLLGTATVSGASSVDANDNELLILHHTSNVTDKSKAAIRAEVEEITTAAKQVIDPFENWLLDDGPLPSGDDETKFDGRDIAYAVGTRVTEDESYRHFICTVDENNNTKLDMLYQYYVGTPDSDCYQYSRVEADGRSMTLTTWDEKNGQRSEVTYAVHERQWDDSWNLYDVWHLWYIVMASITDGINRSLGNEGFSSQVPETGDIHLVSSDSGSPVGAVGGYVSGKAQDHAARKALGLPSNETFAHMLKDANEGMDVTRGETQQRIAEEGSNRSGVQRAITTGKVGGEIILYTAASEGIGAATSGSPIADKIYSAVGDTVVDTSSSYLGAWFDGMKYNYRLWEGKDFNYTLYALFRKQKNLELQGHFNYMWLIRLGMRRKTLDVLWKHFKKDELAWINFNAKLNDRANDPSGVVYEAVLSNPVKGATVQLYRYNPAAANAGFDDVATFVDSNVFGIEENPQLTGEDGRYQWFVPEGFWQVRVSKSGYESFSTGSHEECGLAATKDLDGDGTDDAAEYWMPVLPIQLDVNIPLVSLASPKIVSMEAGQDGVTVSFSKYMRVDSVTCDLFAVNGLEPAAIEAVDGEEAGDGSGVLLARTFLLAYPKALNLAVGNNDLALAYDDAGQKATSYAGVTVSAQDANESVTTSVDMPPVDIARATVAAIANKTYTGKAQKPAVSVTFEGRKLAAGTDFTVAYANNTKAGTASVTLTGIGDFTGTKRVTFTISKAAQTITVANTECVTKKTAKLGAKTSGDGKLTYKSSNAKVATVSAKGVVKGVKAGKAKITITAAETANYKKATKVVTVKVGKANTLGAKAKKKVVAVAAGKTAANNVAVTKPVGKVTYKNASTNATAKKFKVAVGTGKITVPKGTKKGTYAVKITVKAAGNASTISGTKTVTFKVQVK